MSGVERCALSSQMGREERKSGHDKANRERRLTTWQNLSKGVAAALCTIRVVMHRYKLEDKDKGQRQVIFPKQSTMYQ